METPVYLVRPLGFEPRTNGLRVHCSAIELEALGGLLAPCGPEVYGAWDAPDTDRSVGVSEGT